jgi:hypothetical protein
MSGEFLDHPQTIDGLMYRVTEDVQPNQSGVKGAILRLLFCVGNHDIEYRKRKAILLFTTYFVKRLASWHSPPWPYALGGILGMDGVALPRMFAHVSGQWRKKQASGRQT